MSMNVAVIAGRYKGWGCWFLKNGPVELVLVPQVGGRIMGIRWRGHDLSFTQPEIEGQVVDVAAACFVSQPLQLLNEQLQLTES